MGPGGTLLRLAARLHRAIDRLAQQRDHRRAVFSVAIAVAAAIAVFVEVHFGPWGHGTHLLLLLLLVMVGAVAVGPPAGVAALGIGAAGTAAAWAVGLGPDDPPAKIVAQLILFLATGTAYLGLLQLAIRRSQERLALPSGGIAAARDTHPLLDPLSPRELEILRLVGAGKTTDEVGRLLFLSPNTVKTHLSHAYAKLAARNRTDAIRAALHCGCLTAEDICPHLTAMAVHDATNG